MRNLKIPVIEDFLAGGLDSGVNVFNYIPQWGKSPFSYDGIYDDFPTVRPSFYIPVTREFKTFDLLNIRRYELTEKNDKELSLERRRRKLIEYVAMDARIMEDFLQKVKTLWAGHCSIPDFYLKRPKRYYKCMIDQTGRGEIILGFAGVAPRQVPLRRCLIANKNR